MAGLYLKPELPEISLAKLDEAKLRLQRELGESVVATDVGTCERFVRDESEAIGRTPCAVVFAENREQIKKTLELAEKLEVPVTPRAGGTSRVGGAVPVAGGIVLAVSKMNQILDIDTAELSAVIEPGVSLSEFHTAVEALGLFYPPDPNSVAACTLGGNAATNAGGPRAFKYGVTRDYILGIDALLIGGRELQVGYATRKGVTGYDLRSLFVGSEGTLAVFDKLRIRLLPKPEELMTILALFDSVHHAGRAATEMISRKVIPRCLELLDRRTLQAMREAGNAIPENAGAMLLIEMDGSEAQVQIDAERVSDACESVGAIEILVAQDAAQRDRLWAARREMSPAVRRMAKNKLSEDIAVPRTKISELLTLVEKNSEENRIKTVAYGHAGDGNLHVNFLWDHEDEVPRVSKAIERLFRDTVALGGTLSGEHGVGVLKSPYLPIEQSFELIQIQRELKSVFDPKGLLNPGKIFPPDSIRERR